MDHQDAWGLKIKFMKLRDNAIIPAYQSTGASGFDLHTPEAVCIPSKTTVLVKTGLAVEIPEGFEMQIRARSGVAYRTSVIIKNGIGTIDSDYRGEIGVLMHNLGDEDVWFEAGERIAQGVITPVVKVIPIEVKKLKDTDRGGGGFGSTGQ